MTENYYSLTAEQALTDVQSQLTGLSAAEAEARGQKYGPNALAEGKKKSAFMVFLSQFKDLLVVILIAAGIISMVSGQGESTIVIFAVILLNAILGTVQHFKAEKSLESLKAMSAPIARVLRDGVRQEIPSKGVMPGDILLLEAGDLVVADGRILQNYSLKINESSLTGESEAVEKSAEVLSGSQVALGDQKNMVFSGSLVTYGRATVLVTGTGMQTELGKIAALMNATQQRKTPLQQSLDSFSGKLAVVILIISAIVFGLSVYRKMEIIDALMFAVALAVAAIPEALSSIVTIVLALGTQKMAKQNAIIKDLKAVESLGSVSVICSDKTGTLTQNKMTVQKIYAGGMLLEGQALQLAVNPQRLLLKAAVLASDATTDEETGAEIGDPTEVALIRLSDYFGVEENSYRQKNERLKELAFDSDRKLMSTLNMCDNTPILHTKGAIDVLLSRATMLVDAEGISQPMTDTDREELLRVNQELSEQGLRVLAFAYKELPEVRELTLDDEYDFTFIGLISMIDPPRPESVQAVKDAALGGIRTVMITGDHKVTATAIAKQIGIFQPEDLSLEGVELDAMTDEELDEKLTRISVYARVSPEHKIRIVNAWQRRGAIVSMTGDGVNDAPALKKADIGVAMGITGTEVSKDAASMILADDNFATIIKAVVNGRNVYANIKNAIKFLLSGNTAAIFCVLYTSLMGLPMPFAPVHLLFINLLTDSLPAIAIGMEPAQDDLIRQKPRDPKEPILTRSLLGAISGQGLLIAIATMIAFYTGLSAGGAMLASTMAFSTLSLARLFHGFNCRASKSIFSIGLLSNKYSLMAFGAGVLFLAAVLFLPLLSTLFLVAPLTGGQIGMIILLAFAPTAVIQLCKVVAK